MLRIKLGESLLAYQYLSSGLFLTACLYSVDGVLVEELDMNDFAGGGYLTTFNNLALGKYILRYKVFSDAARTVVVDSEGLGDVVIVEQDPFTEIDTELCYPNNSILGVMIRILNMLTLFNVDGNGECTFNLCVTNGAFMPYKVYRTDTEELVRQGTLNEQGQKLISIDPGDYTIVYSPPSGVTLSETVKKITVSCSDNIC